MFEPIGRRLRAYAEKDGRGYPDWAMRYVPVVAKLRKRRLAGARILELGANESGLARFARTRVIVVDLNTDHLRAAARTGNDVLPVRADLCALPFRPDCADVCVCIDTFEHMPPEARRAAAGQIMDVLRNTGTAVVAFPAGDGALRAEQAIQDAYRRYTGRTFSWLDEHARHGLPDPARVITHFQDAAGDTHRVVRSGNAPLWLWTWMWKVLICGWPGRGNALFQALMRALTPLLCRLRFGACYRAMIWIEPRQDRQSPVSPLSR